MCFPCVSCFPINFGPSSQLSITVVLYTDDKVHLPGILLPRSWPCGMDVIRWSTQKAIYPLFVLLRSFNKANSLKADWVRKKEGEEQRDIHPLHLQLYIKWIELIMVACILCVHFHIHEFSQEDESKRRRPSRGNGKWRWGEVWIWLKVAKALLIGTKGHLIPGNQQLQTDS